MIIKIIIYLVLSVSGLLLFKMGGGTNNISISLNNIKASFSTLSLLGVICYGCSFLVWLNIIKDSEISYIYPIVTGLVTIMIIVGGVLVLNEKVQLMQWIGIGCIIIGILIVNIFK